LRRSNEKIEKPKNVRKEKRKWRGSKKPKEEEINKGLLNVLRLLKNNKRF